MFLPDHASSMRRSASFTAHDIMDASADRAIRIINAVLAGAAVLS